MARTILVTGGAGFIGSHTSVVLLEAGHRIVVVDDLSNSSPVALDRVQELAGASLHFHRVDIVDEPALEEVFEAHEIDSVIHFAGLKAVGESVEFPLRYYRNNIRGTVTLLEVMARRGVKDLVFSSSATVYGQPETMPITEDTPLQVASPYGRTKLQIEDMCRDVADADAAWRIVLLRYFNPVGAHPSGRIGEDPNGIPNNLMPYIMQVAAGKRPFLRVWGDDYPTEDGTGVRDYIHVVDLAEGHLAALDALAGTEGCAAYNLGTGRGHSVLQVLAAASRAVGREIPHEIHPRRPGDVTTCYADPSRAAEALGWRTRRDIDEMCRDAWNWQSLNPEGYRT